MKVFKTVVKTVAVQLLIKSGSLRLWTLVCREYKTHLIRAIREHLLLDVVKMFEEESAIRMQTIIDWLNTSSSSSDSFDELLTGRILDCALKYSEDEANNDRWKWEKWTKPLLRKAHQNGRLGLERLELIATEHCLE